MPTIGAVRTGSEVSPCCCGCPAWACSDEPQGSNDAWEHYEGACFWNQIIEGTPQYDSTEMAAAKAALSYPGVGTMRLDPTGKFHEIRLKVRFYPGDRVTISYNFTFPEDSGPGTNVSGNHQLTMARFSSYPSSEEYNILPDVANPASSSSSTSVRTFEPAPSPSPLAVPGEWHFGVFASETRTGGVTAPSINISAPLGATFGDDIPAMFCPIMILRSFGEIPYGPLSDFAYMDFTLRDSEGELVSWLDRITEATPP